MKIHNVSYDDICRYRSEYMGLAMVLVVFYHLPFNVGGSLLSTIKYFGFAGVDIFIFLLGWGGYCSYIKDHDGYGYLMRRIGKLFPVYLSFCLIWLPYQFVAYKMNAKSIIGNLFAVEGFTGTRNEFNWYITCLVVFCIIIPYLSELVFRNNRNQNWLIIALSFLISVPFWGSQSIMIASRAPILILGMIFGKNRYTVISRRKWVYIILLFVCGILFLEVAFLISHEAYLQMGIFWYPQILIVPSGFLIFFAVLEYFQKTVMIRLLCYILRIIGKNTFEIYLSHIFLNRIAQKNDLGGYTNLIICLGGILPMVIILKVASRYVSSL